MANRLDVVAVEVADERAEVVRVVFGPQPRLMQRFGAEVHLSRIAQHAKHFVVERPCLREVCMVDAEVVHHAGSRSTLRA
jgi:hypothetical protein